MLRDIIRNLLELIRGFSEALKQQSIEALELELIELEHAFYTLVLGSLAGIPGIPPGLAIEVLPVAGQELKMFLDRSGRGGDVLGDYFSRFGGEW